MGSGIALNGKELFPSDYLSAVDLAGKDHSLTISAVERVGLMNPGSKREESKVRISFAGAKKFLVCNKTNAKTIAGLHGTEATKWIGKAITIYPTKCRNGPSMVDCIRVRDAIPAARQAQAPAPATAPVKSPADEAEQRERDAAEAALAAKKVEFPRNTPSRPGGEPAMQGAAVSEEDIPF